MNLYDVLTKGPSRPFADEMMADLAALEESLLDFCGDAAVLETGLDRIVRSGGKRLRPLLAWTCWHLAGRKMDIVPLMAMLELMHTSSLIHDDFVDCAALRRGVPTISSESGGLAALRSGDYLLSRAMTFLKVYRGTGINEGLSEVSQEMCIGELEQRAGLFKAAGLTEEMYKVRIRRKTALFMAESCRGGAVAGGADASLTEALWQYGYHLGIAFQMRDDLLDWKFDASTGKSPLQDLRSGVITLPVIYAMETADESFCAMVEKPEKSSEDVDKILNHVFNSGAVKKARMKTHDECGTAVKALGDIPEGPEKSSLILLAKAVSKVNDTGKNNL